MRIRQRLGAWETVRAVGSGGLGEVFEARRADGQYDGRAAVKLLKRGMDSAAVLQRFAQERQALVRLSHAHRNLLEDRHDQASGQATVADLRRLCRDVVLEYGDAITCLPDSTARKEAMLTSTLAQPAGGDNPFQVEIGTLCARLADLQVADNWSARERPETAEQQARRAAAMLFTGAAAHDADARHWWVRALRALAKCAQQQRAFDARSMSPWRISTRPRASPPPACSGLSRYPLLLRERAAVLMQRASVHFGYNAPNQNQPDAALAVLAQAQALSLGMTRRPGAVSMEDVFQVCTVAGSRALIFAR